MSSADLPGSTPEDDSVSKSGEPEAAKKQPVKRKRRWGRYVVGIVVFLILLVVLLPTLLSTSPGKSLVLGVANGYLNGKVEVADWSLGWFSGIRATGVKVFDDKKELILEIGSFKTDMSVSDAARGKYELGDTVVDGLNLVRVEIDQDGRSNYEKLLKAGPVETRPPGGGKSSGAAAELPDVSGTITVNYSGTINAAGVTETLHILPGRAVVRIPNINQPITNDIKLELQVGDAAPGSIVMTGSADIAENNKLVLESANIDQNVEIKSLNLAVLEQLARTKGYTLQAAGVANGVIQMKTAGVQNASFVVLINASNVALKSPLLRGDTYSSVNVSIPIKMSLWRSGDDVAVKIDEMDVNADQCFVKVKANASLASLKAAGSAIPEAISAALQGRAPTTQMALDTGDGWVTIAAGADIKALADQLPQVIALQQGAKIDSGKLTHETRLNLGKTDAPIASTTRIELAGRSAGRQVTLQPIELKVEGNLIGLRDVGIHIVSGFLNVSGGGTTLKKIDLKGDFDLAIGFAELDPLINVGLLVNGPGGGPVAIAGSGEFAVATDGDPTSPDALVNASLTSTIRGVNITGVSTLPAIQQEFTRLGATAQISTKDIGTIPSASVTLTAGAENAPFLDLAAGIRGLNLKTYSCGFALQKLNVTDLARLQREFGALVPTLAEKGITVAEGQLSATVSGTFDGKTLKTDQPLTISGPSLTIVKKTAEGQTVALLSREQLDVSVGGRFELLILGNKVAGSPALAAADISELSVSTQSNIVQISKTKDAPLKLQLPGGGISGQGSLRIISDAKRVSDFAQALGGQVTSVTPLKSGILDATVTLTGDAANGGTIEMAGTIDKLSIATAQQPIDNQKVVFSLSGKTPKDLATVAFNANVDSSFLKATITNGVLKPNAPTLDMLDSATVEIAADSLPNLQALANSFSVPLKVVPNADGTPAPGPLVIASGNANAKLIVSRDGRNLKITGQGVRAGSLVVGRDGREFAFDQKSPITADFVATLATTPDATGKKTLMEQINSVQISQLKVSAPRILQIAMTEPSSVTNLSTTPSANGAIQVTTTIEAVAPLLAVLQGGEALPYRGNIVVTQKFKSSGGPTSLEGETAIDQFKVMNGREVMVAEDKLTILNSVDIDTIAHVMTIRNVEVNAPQSQAVSLKMTGQIQDYLKTRTIKGLGNDPAMTLALGYDLEKVWKIIFPMLTPEQKESYKDVKPSGNEKTTFRVAGMYPAVDGRGNVVPFNVSVRYLTADGALPVTSLVTGFTDPISALNIPVTLKAGIFSIAPTMKPAKIGKGEIQLAGLSADLTQPTIRVSTQENLALLKDVSINPALGDKIGKFINPVFANSTRASGLLSVTINRAQQVALGDQMKTAESGSAQVTINLNEMDIANPLGSLIVGGFGAFGKNIGSDTETFRGQIRQAVVTLDRGVTTQNITMEVSDPNANVKRGEKPPVYAWNFTGDVRLSDLRQKIALTLPANLMQKWLGEDIAKFLPSGLPLALTGTTLKPEIDFGAAFRSIGEAQLKAGVLGKSGLGNVLGGGNASTQPGEKSNPIEDILKGLGNKDKKEKEKKSEPAPPRRPRS